MDIIYNRMIEKAKMLLSHAKRFIFSLSRRFFVLNRHKKQKKQNKPYKRIKEVFMRRLILALATFIFCSLWAEVKVEKVLETT
ncbi:MAG: hypothetical protein ACUVQ3_09060, partial [bacterium]